MAQKIGEETLDLDLLGDPLQPIRDPRGRPAFAKNKENQLLVISLRGAGYTIEEIASFMRCDAKTVRKHFSRELDHGALFLDGLAVQVLVKKMLEGNVGAAKQVREIAQIRSGKTDPKKVPVKTSLLGKKDQLNASAGQVPDDWGNLLDGGKVQ